MGHARKYDMKKLSDMVNVAPKPLSKKTLYQYPHYLTSKPSKHQFTITLISTEVEFVVACDTANIILYICTMLEKLDLEQDQVTIIY